MTFDPIGALRSRVPEWFSVETMFVGGFQGLALISSEGAATDDIVELKVWLSGSKISVAEPEPGTAFPKRCPERHIKSRTTS